MARSSETSAEKITYLERRPQVLALRKAGASLRQIADQFGISHEQVRQDIKASLALTVEETKIEADELRAMELERIDMAMLAIATQVKAGHLGAIDRWVKLIVKRCELLGLDAPIKQALDAHLKVTVQAEELNDDELATIIANSRSSGA